MKGIRRTFSGVWDKHPKIQPSFHGQRTHALKEQMLQFSQRVDLYGIHVRRIHVRRLGPPESASVQKWQHNVW